MKSLNVYGNDGASYQARAVLAVLQGKVSDGLECSWNTENTCYDAEVKVARWENCREQGYVVILRKGPEQLNIAFFKHQNSDDICAVRWEQVTTNSPTIGTAQFGKGYKSKYDVSKSVGCHKFVEMADWIIFELTAFWCKNS